jgi:hypothetical protein
VPRWVSAPAFGSVSCSGTSTQPANDEITEAICRNRILRAIVAECDDEILRGKILNGSRS